MNTTRHVAHAVASTGSTQPAYRVDLRAGNHQLVADEPAASGGGDLGPSPFELLLSDWPPARRRPCARTPPATAGRSPRSTSASATTSITKGEAPSSE